MSRIENLSRAVLAGLFVSALIATSAGAEDAAGKTPADKMAEAKAIIFAKEQKIYGDRATGSMAYYAASTSPNYLGWPPTAAKPFPRQDLSSNNAGIKGSKEKIDTQLVDFTMDGDTALIYYSNHRTARGDGTPVDEKFSNIHVWVKRDGDWKLLGGMARPTLPPIK
jgi:ketosteroid isomerase-like protein